MSDRCSTSLSDTCDPFIGLEGDSGEAGAWATCLLCYARLQLLPAVGGGAPRVPVHDNATPSVGCLRAEEMAALLLAEKGGLHATVEAYWRAVDRNYDNLVDDAVVRELRAAGLLVPRGPGPLWSAATRLRLAPNAVVLDPSPAARALLCGVRPQSIAPLRRSLSPRR
jgi:hypothetical protein